MAICPCCAYDNKEILTTTLAKEDGLICSCDNCDTLLIIKEERLIEFHEYLKNSTS